MVEQDVAQKAPDERADDADDDRSHDPDRVLARNQQPGQCAGDKTHDQQCDDQANHVFTSCEWPV